MKRYTRVTAIVSLAVLGLVSCGGDGDRLSEEEFVEQANAISAAGNERLEEAGESLAIAGGQPSPEEAQAFLDTLVEDVGGQLDDIDALSPPEDLETDIDELLTTAREALEGVEEAGGEGLFSQEDPFAETNELAGEIGLTECGGG